MKEQAVRGAIWILVDTAGGQILSFLAFLILARLLVPEDYGILSLAAAIIAVPQILLNEGFGTALIQRDMLDDVHINAAFWANLALSIIFVIAAQIGAPWAAMITGTALIEPVIRWLSLTMIAIALTAIAAGLFIRDLKYSTFALRTLIANSVGALTGVAMALLGYGVWALVGMQLCTSALGVLIMWKGVRWRPTASFSWPAFREIYRFSTRLMVGNGLRFATERADNIIIGIFLDPAALGFYFLVTRLLTTVIYITISPVDRIMLPVLTRIKDDPHRRSEAYASMVGVTAVFWIPAVAGLGVVAPLALPLLFGHKWDASIPLMMIMSLVCISGPLNRPTMHALLAVGKPEIYAMMNLIQLVITTITFLVAVRFGIVGAAWAYAAVLIAMVPFNLAAARRVAGISPMHVMRRYLPALGAGVIMALVVLLISPWLPEPSRYGAVSQVINLVVEMAVGILVYAVSLYALVPRQVREYVGTAYDALPESLKFRRKAWR
jgi:O-antigen/teichoic acid export membrane protein